MNLLKFQNDETGEADYERHNRLFELCHTYLIHQFDLYSPTKLFSTDKEHSDAEDWCEEHFKNRYCLWNNVICCRDSNDLANFLLRWAK